MTILDPAKLVFLLIGLAAWWFAVPQLSRMVTGSDGSASPERSRRRACVVSAAQHLALPAPVRTGYRIVGKMSVLVNAVK